MTEIKSCPFCGNKAWLCKIYKQHSQKTRSVVKCIKCNAYMEYRDDKSAIEAWNRRVENEKEREALTEIKELIDKYCGVDPIYYTGGENAEEVEAARLCCCINEIINSVEDAQTF